MWHNIRLGHQSAFSGNVNIFRRIGRPNYVSKSYQSKFSKKKVVWYRWSAVVYGDRPIIIWIFKNFAEFSNIFQKIGNESLMRIQLDRLMCDKNSRNCMKICVKIWQPCKNWQHFANNYIQFPEFLSHSIRSSCILISDLFPISWKILENSAKFLKIQIIMGQSP